MPEALETEKIMELESFRKMIKSVVEKIKEKNATAAEIANVQELDEDDLNIWKKFQIILSRIEQLAPSVGVQDVKDVLGECYALKSMVGQEAKTAKEENKYSKVSFCAVINNKNPINFVELAIEALEKGDVAAIAQLKEDINGLRNQFSI